MKRILYIFFACAFSMGMYAQETVVTSDNTDKTDSLTQVVSKLSAKVQKVEDDKRNESIWKKRSKYFHIGYINQTLTHQDISGLKWKSDFGVSLGFGHTYYLHRRALFNMLKFGLDITWLDISYAKYSQPKEWTEPSESTYPDEDSEDFDLGVHQVELGLHIGPSITLNPIDYLKLSGYFHFIPSGSIVIMNDEANASYVSNFAVGGAIAYKAISLGIESRWGKAKYNSFAVDEDAVDTDDIGGGSDVDIDNVLVSGKNRLKTKSLRFYLIFRF